MYKYLRINPIDFLSKAILVFVTLAVTIQISFVALDLSGYEKVAKSVNTWFIHTFDGSFNKPTDSVYRSSFVPVQYKTVYVNTVVNSVKIGPMTGNKNLAFGVKNIIEEVAQDKGYNLANKEDAQFVINTNIVYMDQKQTNTNVSIFHKDENAVIIRMEGVLLDNKGKIIKRQTVTDESSEISTSTLLVSESGQFNSTVMRNAVKKTCVALISKLLD
jgi:hypothetical protein